MTIDAAIELAERLMRQHGLSCWTVMISNSNTHLGYCWYKPRCQIELSRNHILKDTDEQITNTILHEIAHALTGYIRHKGGKGEHHGAAWKATAIRIGAKPEACCSNSAVKVKDKWKIKCPKCPYFYTQYKTPQDVTINRKCPKCATIIFWERII